LLTKLAAAATRFIIARRSTLFQHWITAASASASSGSAAAGWASQMRLGIAA